MTRGKFDRDGAGGKEAVGMEYCSINIRDGSELKLARSRENSSYSESKFPVFLLSNNSNKSIFNAYNFLKVEYFLIK